MCQANCYPIYGRCPSCSSKVRHLCSCLLFLTIFCCQISCDVAALQRLTDANDTLNTLRSVVEKKASAGQANIIFHVLHVPTAPAICDLARSSGYRVTSNGCRFGKSGMVTFAEIEEERLQKGANFFAVNSSPFSNKADWFMGKFVHFTLISNPVERTLSHLLDDFQANKYGWGKDYQKYSQKWLAHHPDNYVVRFLLGHEGWLIPKWGVTYQDYARARDQLHKFSVVVILEAYIATLPLLTYKLNWTHFNPAVTLSSSSYNAEKGSALVWHHSTLYDVNFFDMMLYRDALALARRQVLSALRECRVSSHCKSLASHFRKAASWFARLGRPAQQCMGFVCDI